MNSWTRPADNTTGILIVEDSPTQAEALRYVLERNGYMITVVGDGRQALNLISAHQPALVISDIVMPEMDGYELCRRIKGNERFRDAPVILLTSLSNAEDVLEALACGADSFITKPYRADYLLAHVKRTLARQLLRSNKRPYVEVEIGLAGKSEVITADPQRMVGLLLSTYEAAIHRNAELIQVQDELNALNEHLEALVDERTATLSAEITERQRAKEALHQLNAELEQRVADRTAELRAANLRLTELDHLKDEFMSRTSHELRTPLTNIKIYLELLETAKPEKREKYMKTLNRETDRLYALIEGLLAFSELTLKIDLTTLSPIDLNNLIAGRLTTWQKLSAGHDLLFQLDLARDVPHVRVDSELFMQALNRLITNAVSYTPTGSVIVSTACIDAADHRWFTVSVTDTGPGITPEDLPHIFEQFYRGRAAADYKTPGTGVGLSLSREIAEKLGGRLTAETKVGAGSTFTMWLPVGTEIGDDGVATGAPSL